MTVNIKIIGTKKDSKILKKALREYAERADKSEREECACLIELIESAERKADERLER